MMQPTEDMQRTNQESLEKVKALLVLESSEWTATVEVDERSGLILSVQARHGRDVVTLQPYEEEEVVAICAKHIKRATESGRSIDSEDLGRAMFKELGEWFRDSIADKIDDQKVVLKEPLSPEYAAWKGRHGGGGKPILVFTGELRDDVRGATVTVEKR